MKETKTQSTGYIFKATFFHVNQRHKCKGQKKINVAISWRGEVYIGVITTTVHHRSSVQWRSVQLGLRRVPEEGPPVWLIDAAAASHCWPGHRLVYHPHSPQVKHTSVTDLQPCLCCRNLKHNDTSHFVQSVFVYRLERSTHDYADIRLW